MIERNEYLEKLIKLKDKSIIKVLTGIRRSGKSTILIQYKEYLIKQGVNENNIIHINFEDADNINLLDWKILHDYILKNTNKNKKNYVFLDEIQRVDEFEKCINSLALKDYIDLYITGSNSYLLSSELATYLTGRYIEIHILPLSFKEFLSHYGETDKLEKFDTYKEFGGFPYLIYLDNDEELMKNYLDSIYNTIIMKDVISRRKVKDPLILESIVKFLFNNIGSPVSTKKISDTLNSDGRKNSVHTIEEYLDALLDSFILYKVDRFDIKGKQLLKTQEKYYLSDLGFRTYLLGKSNNNDIGHILENIIFLELKRRGYKIFVGKASETEVDFVVENHNDIKYIQVSLSIRDEKVFEREIKPLKMIKDNHPKYIITLDYDTNDFDGIKLISAIDFLTGKVDI